MRRLPEAGQVAVLGLIQGACELVPVSSSAHVAAVPWLLGWSVAEWPAARRKELEVALHAGAVLALAPALLRLLPRPWTVVLSLLPPVVAGYCFERAIEERFGGRLGLAAGLLGGSVVMVVADRRSGPRRGGQVQATQRGLSGQDLSPGALLPRGGVGEAEALGLGARRLGARGSLALGLAQAAALAPGVSRTGATLAAARALGFSRPEASRLSFGVAGPVLVGATALKVWRGRKTADLRLVGVGAGAAFVGARLALRVFGLERGPLWPFAAERAVLAGIILAVRYRRPR